MGTYFNRQDLDRLRMIRAALLGMEGRPDGEEADRYWGDTRDVELYDQIFAARIGWKWDAVLGEVELRGGLGAEPKTLVDWGSGTGIAARKALGAFPSLTQVLLYDRDAKALQFAQSSIAEAFPNVTIKASQTAPEEGADLAVASHVLDELDGDSAADLIRVLRASTSVLWVEPGSKKTSRALGVHRDALLDEFTIVAPCTHQASCGMFTPDHKKDWCHLFAKPPAEVHTTGEWSEIHRELRIDLRSLPYSYVALTKAAVSASPKPGVGRVLGRPRFQRGRVLLDLCQKSGVSETQMLQRTDKAFFKELKKNTGEVLLMEERDGELRRV